jgi:hypothetical protein
MVCEICRDRWFECVPPSADDHAASRAIEQADYRITLCPSQHRGQVESAEQARLVSTLDGSWATG